MEGGRRRRGRKGWPIEGKRRDESLRGGRGGQGGAEAVERGKYQSENGCL